MARRFQVIVVGGGPVGVALAVDIGLRGVTCALVETRVGLSSIPKGQNLTQRTMEHFQFWGVVEQIRAARTAPEGYPIGEVTFYKSLNIEYWHAPPGREMVRAFYSQANDRLPQYQTEKVLRAKMDTLPNVTSYFGWTAKSVKQDDHGVQIAIEQHDGPGREVLESDYAVGCDGPRSMVRDQIGIERSGTHFDQLMVLLVFRSRDLHEALEKFPPRSTYRVMHPDLQGYWQFFGRIDVGQGWFFHSPVPADSTRENFDFHGLLEKVCGFKVKCEYDHVGFWDLRVSVAKRYRVGRVFIAGDAAHSHPPYGGFGCRTRPTSAGRSRRDCRAGAATACCAPTARSAGPYSRKPPRISSPRGSNARASCCIAPVRRATGPHSKPTGSSSAPTSAGGCSTTSRTTKAHRW